MAYIDRDLALKTLNRNSITKKITLVDGISIYDSISNLPIADVVKVVRCKDCEYWQDKNSKGTQGICLCGEKEMNYGGEFYSFANDFCSYGERKE